MALSEHLEKLRHFHKLTQFNSINEAAMNTGLSQAGLSKSLILLESELNCKLFKRSREGLTLTREGSELLEATKKILSEAAEVENRLRSLQASSTPRVLRIGMYDSIAVYFGIELSEYLKAVYPKVRMSLHADSSSRLFEQISSDQLDIVIGVNFPKSSKSGLTYHHLFDDHYSFYCVESNVQQMDELSVIVHPSATDETGAPLTKILARDLKGRNIHLVSNFETIKTLAQKGLGIGVMPTQVAAPLIASKELVSALPNQQRQHFGRHHIGFLVRDEVSNTFGDFIKDILRLGNRQIG